MKKYFISLVLLLISCLSGNSQELVNKGKFYLNELQFKKAKNCFLAELKKMPDNIDAIIGLGDYYISVNEIDSAKTIYQKAVSLNPKNPFAWIGMGKVALLSSDRINENEYFDRARRTDKTNPEVYCAVAEACINLSKQDTVTALLFLHQGLSVNQKYAGLHLSTGNLESVKKNYGYAANAYDRAIFFDPKSALAYRNLGNVYTISRAYKDAQTAYLKSVELNPDQIMVYRFLGEMLYKTAQYTGAEQVYKSYFTKAEVSLDDKEQFAFILFFNKKYKEAADLLEQVLAVNHDESVLLRIRGYIAYESGEYEKGLNYMNQFFKLHDPKQLIALDYIYYARILQKTGKDAPARENYEKAIALDPAKLETYEEIARLVSKNGQHKEAAIFYKKIIEKGGDKLQNSFLAGKEYFFEGEKWRSSYDSIVNLKKNGKISFPDSASYRKNQIINYLDADSAFTIVTLLSKNYAGGFIWKGRVQSLLDPEALNSDAKEAYETALTLLLKAEPAINQKSIIECYRYLGSWYFLGYDKLFASDKQKAAELRAKSIEYFTRISELDPADAQAKDVLSKMKGKK